MPWTAFWRVQGPFRIKGSISLDSSPTRSPMAKDWYYAKEGQQRGPFPESHVFQLGATGQLLPHDLVWHEGLADWVAAHTIPGLIPEKARAALTEQPAPTDARPARLDEPAPSLAESPSDFPPWLAVLLAVFTLGIFSVWYTWRVSNRYASELGQRARDAVGRPLGRVRHPAWVLLLSYATLGIYFCYWVYAALRECGRFSGDATRTPSDVTLMAVFPPYAIYCLVFKLPDALRRVRAAAGIKDADVAQAHDFLNPLMFPALPYLAMRYQDLLNEAWAAASSKSGE